MELEPGKVLIAGGRIVGIDIYTLDLEYGDVTYLPNMPRSRTQGLACGVVLSEDRGGVDIVIAGGDTAQV